MMHGMSRERCDMLIESLIIGLSIVPIFYANDTVLPDIFQTRETSRFLCLEW